MNSTSNYCEICDTLLQTRACSCCSSLERQRALARIISEGLILEPTGNLLIVSPAVSEVMLARRWNVSIDTLDVRASAKTSIVGDICSMAHVPSCCYNTVYASGVLRHVYNDCLALSEIRRVLVGDGVLMITDVIKGPVTKELSPPDTSWYGIDAYNNDKVAVYRRYGFDFELLLRTYFDSVKHFRSLDPITNDITDWYICQSPISV